MTVNEPEGLSKSARSALSHEGYAFQDAVARRIGKLTLVAESYWSFEVAELPVQVGTNATRIDLVLKNKDGSRHMVIECKRVHSSFGWCFARLEHVRRDYDPHEILLMEAVRTNGSSIVYVNVHVREHVSETPVYHLGLPFKIRPAEGAGSSDSGGSPRRGVEDALSQCMIGANGLVNLLDKHGGLMAKKGKEERSLIIPAVFTTARLFVLPEELSDAELTTGNLNSTAELIPQAWLWLRYTHGPDIGHDAVTQSSEAQRKLGNTLSRVLDNAFARTVAIVAPDGIGDFLTACSRLEDGTEDKTAL